jgi:hypothetical protein
MSFKRFVVFLAAFLFALTGTAAMAAERSPFFQGHWWNPARAGSGFDFFSVEDRAMVIWYTYEPSGRPVWYTAQGNVPTMGSQPWPLLRHRWTDGRKQPATEVGWLRITIRSFESAILAWNIGGSEGSWPIERFAVSEGTNTVDHTGSWFDPSNSGWGMNVTEQGDVFGGVLFTYDPAGEPVWAAGFDRERNVAELHTFDGACPSCAYRPSVSTHVGRVAFDFTGDTAAVIHNRLSLPMAAGLNIDGAALMQLSRPASTRPADRLETYLGGKFSFAADHAVGAPHSTAQVSIERTGGAYGAFDIFYEYEGPGCARNEKGLSVRFADGDVSSKTVSIPMGALGLCRVWLAPPPAPATLGAHNLAGVTVVPVVAGCPTPSNVTYVELGGIGNPLLQMQRSGQTVFMPLPAPTDGRASGQVTFSESPNAATPQPVTMDISISRCPGIIDTHYGNYCNLHSTNGHYNAIVYLATAYQTINAGNVSQYGYCWAGDAGPYYVNARWTYSSCPSGLSSCGFAIQRNNGPF